SEIIGGFMGGGLRSFIPGQSICWSGCSSSARQSRWCSKRPWYSVCSFSRRVWYSPYLHSVPEPEEMVRFQYCTRSSQVDFVVRSVRQRRRLSTSCPN